MATVQCIQQANAPRDPGWTDLLAQAPTASPTLAQTVLAVPPDADSRELRYDGTSGRTTGKQKRRAQPSCGDEPSTQPGPDDVTGSDRPSTVTTHPPSVATDINGQGGMVTRGSKKKAVVSVQPSEQPGVDSQVRATGEASVSGEGGPATSPIVRRGADILAEVVEDLAMDDAGNLREPPTLVASPLRPVEATGAATTVAPAQPDIHRIRRERVRQLTPILRDATARPAERSIMYLSASEIRSQITRYPQAGDTVDNELARQGWYPGRPVGGSLTLLAALIGSWVDRDNFGAPDWMLERAAEYMYANEEEQVIKIGRTTTTPANLVEQLQMQPHPPRDSVLSETHTWRRRGSAARTGGRTRYGHRGIRCNGQRDSDVRDSNVANESEMDSKVPQRYVRGQPH